MGSLARPALDAQELSVYYHFIAASFLISRARVNVSSITLPSVLSHFITAIV